MGQSIKPSVECLRIVLPFRYLWKEKRKALCNCETNYHREFAQLPTRNGQAPMRTKQVIPCGGVWVRHWAATPQTTNAWATGNGNALAHARAHRSVLGCPLHSQEKTVEDPSRSPQHLQNWCREKPGGDVREPDGSGWDPGFASYWLLVWGQVT